MPRSVVPSAPKSVAKKEWSPAAAAVLSFMITGLGQMYKGAVGSGLAWLFFTLLGYVALIVPGLVLHACCVVSAASGEPPERPGRGA
jgi:TM2 domain-containing membrane protein YozV